MKKLLFYPILLLILFSTSCRKENITPNIADNTSLTMGNPSSATVSLSDSNNYLLIKHQYALSYNNSKGEANWVSWHLSSEWLGSEPRCNCFAPDDSLPATFYHVSTSDYTYSGFDRGHQCPSADRDDNSADNSATFLMDNMMPQAPHLNEQTWADFEDYCRTLVNNGNELYVICGGYGSDGTGSNGGVTETIDGGKVNVPSHCWKIAVVLPVGDNDVSRISSFTRIIAVDMPNTQTANSQTWGYYRTSVDAIENNTGFNFLSNIPADVQNVIEANVDSGPTQ